MWLLVNFKMNNKQFVLMKFVIITLLICILKILSKMVMRARQTDGLKVNPKMNQIRANIYFNENSLYPQ